MIEFFAYHEDVEISLRARKFEWIVKYAPMSVVYHKGHGSSRTQPKFINGDFEYKLAILNIRKLIYIIINYGSTKQKLFFVIEYLRSIVASWIGKRLGRNNIGARPYILAISELIS